MGQPSMSGDLYGRIGINATASFTPAASAYTALDIVDVAKEFIWYFADGTVIPPASLIRITTAVLKIDQTALQASEGAYTLRNYSATPPSAQADNAAYSLATGDLATYRGSFSLGTPVDEGGACYVKTTSLLEDIQLASGKSSHFAQLQTVAGFTFTAVARQVFLHGFLL
jgi:hypothetical protein